MSINIGKWLSWIPKLIPIVMGAVNTVESINNQAQVAGTPTQPGPVKQDSAVTIIQNMLTAFQLDLPSATFLSPDFQTLLRKLIDDYVAINNYITKTNTPAIG